MTWCGASSILMLAERNSHLPSSTTSCLYFRFMVIAVVRRISFMQRVTPATMKNIYFPRPQRRCSSSLMDEEEVE